MSLISDPDYLIHNLRLTYLRHVDDPYAPRIISLHPRYLSNSHVLAAGLADYDRWPELTLPASPVPSDDEASNGISHSGTLGATGLKYTQTILGPSRVGAMGMRTSGKRASKIKDLNSAQPSRGTQPKRLRSDSAPTPVVTHAVDSSVSLESTGTDDDLSIQVSKRRSAGGSSLSYISTSYLDTGETTASQDSPITHKNQDQVEGRRVHTRFSSSGNVVYVSENSQNIDPEASSSDFDEDDFDNLESSSDEGDLEYLDRSGIDVEDEFDPDFVSSQLGGASDTASDIISSASMANSGISLSYSMAAHATSQLSQGSRIKNRLSPVNESRGIAKTSNIDVPSGSSTNYQSSNASDSYFEMIVPSGNQSTTNETRNNNKSSQPLISSRDQEVAVEELLFVKHSIVPSLTFKSALTDRLASSLSSSSNPFTELYALIAGRTDEMSMSVNIFFPHTKKPLGKSLQLKVRKDAIVEEVLGFALWSYWEDKWLPKLDEGIDNNDDPKLGVRLSAVGWVLRIAEEDGEVDEDFPAPDRMGRISKFNFEAYAILEANASQIVQNQTLESKIVRRPSRVIVASKRLQDNTTPTQNASSNSETTVISSSAVTNSAGLSTSLGLSAGHGPQVLLRIKVADTDDVAVHYSTTISVSAGMYMQEALELVCRKRKLDNPNEWALLVTNPKTLIFLDRTVASLQGKTDLELVRRSTLPQLGFHSDGDRRIGRTTDPNASIFKRISEVPEDQYRVERDLAAAYKKYTVFRKLPMAVVRLERILAIDGDYIYIIPSASKARAVFDSMKTTPYHIDSVVGCTQSTLSSSSFKLIVKRAGGNKRYDFEAETPRLANEIVTYINELKANLIHPNFLTRSLKNVQVL